MPLGLNHAKQRSFEERAARAVNFCRKVWKRPDPDFRCGEIPRRGFFPAGMLERLAAAFWSLLWSWSGV
jgi:hypothetical protein